ncbi:MAG: beta-ketoacyl-[acyl-carrier-protein] synthase II, partial [Acutalibacteraceae bacterium]|nr:beta-ketoacyl-[acyl-carrier-protein] synthase II [Acutalibacteraceae bacterium]
VEAIASVLSLKNGIVPPTINLDEPDEVCDLNYVPNKAIETQLDVVASSTLGFGGHNAVVAFRKAE